MRHHPSGRQAQLHLHQATIERGGRVLVHRAQLTIGPGDRIGLVGPNGAGKSTLLAALAGQLDLSEGTVEVVPASATVGLVPQELTGGGDGETVAAYLARRTGVAGATTALEAATAALAGDTSPAALDRYQQALDRWLSLGGDQLDDRVATALERVGLARIGIGSVATRALSGGQQARLRLAALLATSHDIILADEPTNDLDTAGLELAEEVLTTTPTPVVVVSHDRRFLERVANTIVEIDPNRQRLIRHNHDYAGYLQARDLARAEEERQYQVYRQEHDRLTERARRQRQWAVRGVQGERRPPDNDRAARGFRIEQTEKLAAKARQSERALERLEEVDKPWEPWELRFTIGQGARSGDLVAELAQAEVTLGSFRLGPVDLTLAAGDRLLVSGANGEGKTTLVRALFGELPPDRGHQRTGPSTVVGWLEQTRQTFTGSATALEVVIDGSGVDTEAARSVLAKFGLGSAQVTRPGVNLSPGERTRAVLALFQTGGVNTLVLDEPTNHLDLEAIEQLESALDGFVGTLVLISHDRAFLDAMTVSREVAVAGGQVVGDHPR